MNVHDYIDGAGDHERDRGPPGDWGGPKAAFAVALTYEPTVTGRINDRIYHAILEQDNATVAFLQWFVTEQVEEEKNAGDILAQIEALGDVIGHLFWLDHHLGKRA